MKFLLRLFLHKTFHSYVQFFLKDDIKPVDHSSAFHSTGVRAYDDTPKFWPSTLLSTNHRTADQSNVMSLFEKSVDGRNFVVPAYRRTLVRRCKRRKLDCLGFRNFKTDISIDVWILWCLRKKGRQINLRSMWQHPCPKSSPEWCLNRPCFRGKWGPSSPILWWRLESEIGKGMCWWHLKYLLAHHLVMHREQSGAQKCIFLRSGSVSIYSLLNFIPS